MAKLVWFTYPSSIKGERILVNAENITYIVPNGKLHDKDKSLIYFNGAEENCIGVYGSVEDIYKTIELA